MKRLVYRSVARDGLEMSEVFAIVETSARNNAAWGVTGFLIHDEDQFFQLLEGPSAAVDAVFGRIKQDQRHSEIVVLSDVPANTAYFPDWGMKRLISFSSPPALEELRTILSEKPNGDHLRGLVEEFLGV